MLVAFWSSAEIRTGVTTNAALISHFYAQRYKKRVALFENHVPGRYSLEDILVGKRNLPFAFEEPIYYGRNNYINYYYGLMKAGLPVNGIGNAAVRMADGKLYYFPQVSSNHNLFDYEMNKIIDRLLDELLVRYEVVFVDLKKTRTLTTKRIIERSDLVFVNVPQDELGSVLSEHSFDKDKTCLLVSRYKKNENIGFDKFISTYSTDDVSISYIPYCESLLGICKNGSLSSFLTKNLWSTRGEKAFELISQLRKITAYIKIQSDNDSQTEINV